GTWRTISTAQISNRVYSLAQAFLNLGIQKGDRITLLAENRWEWAITDFAALAIGAVDVPIYPTLTAEQIGALMADSGSRIAVVSTGNQYEKVARVRAQTKVEQIVVMDDGDFPGAVSFASLLTASADPSHIEAMARSISPDDLATLIYTSGTTGEPKGVMLSHGNIASNVNYSLASFGLREGYSCISFLPLSHITARHLDYALFAQYATVAYCSAFDQLPAAMRQVKPTVFVAVPRVYEKVRQEVERRAALSPLKKRLLRWAYASGQRHREEILHGVRPHSIGWQLAERFVLRKIRDGFGGNVRHFISGGAPLGIDTATWFADVGIRIHEGYGLTETSPVVALNTPAVHRIGSVGHPLPNVQCRFAPDGELLVRGPAVFKGYWQKPQETAAAFDEEGWFHTGDIGRIDDRGFLYVTDRKKELLKTSGGKLIPPQPIENKLKAYLLVAQAALVGDRHKFVSALISPNFSALEEWARGLGIEIADRRRLVSEPRVVARYQAIIDEVNSHLASFETIKRMRLVPDEWSLDTGELTPSLKLKRRIINERYATVIEQIYQDEAVAHG
ncbi:MAG: long-chain fatty acid--CoA ligase, partial [Deltaproteobacteria bacterium]|nr:long-chain fatty acid--CoA ligase [Deltaproteobacteria bacterium]